MSVASRRLLPMALATALAAARYHLRGAAGLFLRRPLPGTWSQPLRGGDVRKGAGDRGGAARYLQPGEDVLQVDAHGAFGHAELAGDLGVGAPGGNQAQQLPLPGG